MSSTTIQREWWRAAAPPTSAVRAEAAADQEQIAFGALMTFTIILLVSPQAWFPAIKSFRIALLSALVAITAHLAARAFNRAPALPFRREMALALGLMAWAALTVPLSIWPGGSVAQLTDHLLKAVIFFWLISTLVTSEARLTRFAWTLSLCSIPLAVTTINNYRAGVYVTSHTNVVQRIAGYLGGSGLAGNPNDMALMLNLLIPITGALLVTSPSVLPRLVTGATLLLSVVAVILTFSRAGFITLAFIGVLTMIAMVRRGALMSVLALVFSATVALAVMPSEYYSRLATITNIEADVTGSAQGRWDDFKLSVEYIRANPLTGAGLGQDLLALNATRGHETWRSVHNAYLQAAVDLGIPGLMILLAFLAASFQNARRVRRTAERNGLLSLAVIAQSISISLGAFAIAAFFHPIAYQFYFFCLAGLAVALVNVCRTRVAPQ
jgi:putative inorganic carbon (HCO3(-)) transporter